MNKLLIPLALDTTLPINFNAFGQSNFLQANVIEDKDTSGSWQDLGPLPAHANAYTYGNICVYTWDVGSALFPNYGFAVRQYAPGVPVNSSTVPLAEDYFALSNGWAPAASVPASIDAVILKNNNDIFIMVSYYANYGFYIDMYKWSGGMLQPAGSPYPLLISQNSSLPYGQINIDAHNRDAFVVTWEESGHIYARAGLASNATVGNLVELKINGVTNLAQPDVALNRTNIGLMANFICTDADLANIYASSLNFNDIYNATTSTLTLNVLDQQQALTGTYEKPRIDAPDNYETDDWSYVVANRQPTRDIIFAGVMNKGIVQHYRLNEGSVGNGSGYLHNIAPKPDHINILPVVAYDNTGHNIFYCWYYYSTVDPPLSGFSDKAYIGMKLTNTGLLIGQSIEYWIAQYYPKFTSIQPAIALSTQNDASGALFMEFLQSNNNVGYIGLKTVPWNTTNGFRPGQPSEIIPVSKQSSPIVSPNPFHESFQISWKNNNPQGIYQLNLIDITGRQILKLQGNLNHINKKLSDFTPSLPQGIYLLRIGGGIYNSSSIKVVKIN